MSQKQEKTYFTFKKLPIDGYIANAKSASLNCYQEGEDWFLCCSDREAEAQRKQIIL